MRAIAVKAAEDAAEVEEYQGLEESIICWSCSTTMD